MKICFLNKSLDIRGGVGRYGRDIVDNISRQKSVEAIVLTEKKSGHKLERAVLRESLLLRDLLNLFVNAFKIRKYIKKCDIIHALDGYPYGVIAALANIGIGRKLVINGIGTYTILPFENPIKKVLLTWAYKQANKVLCISSYTEKQLFKKVRIDSTVVINHGVNYEKFNRSGLTRMSMQNDADTKIILSVAGGLKRRKGIHIAIPAVAEVKKKYPDIKYYIIGSQSDDKEYFYRLKKLVKKYDLVENVVFLENLSDGQLIQFYYSADLFVLTSINIQNDFEGFGLVYLEAGACGKPAIGTFNCGAEDAIMDGITGLLVPQKDIKKTAEAILRILNNPKLAKKLGENGKKRAQQMSWDNVAKKYIKEYKRILA